MSPGGTAGLPPVAESAGEQTLLSAMRPAVLARYGGQLALILALLCLPPLAVALFFGEYRYVWRFAAVAMGLTLAGLGARRLPEPDRVRRNEGYAVTCAAFLLTPPLMVFALAPAGVAVPDLLFETISGVTTTGLSTLSGMQRLDPTFLFTRAFMQWYGGLGIVVLSVALLMQHQAAAMPWIEAAPAGENLMTTLRGHTLRVLKVYLVLTALAVVCARFWFGGWFEAVCHSLSAVATGGFGTRSGSLADLSPGGQIGMTLIAAAGAVSLPLYYRLWSGDWRALARSVELRAYLVLLLLSGAVLSLLYGWTTSAPAGESLRIGFVMGLSAQSTTGFANTPVGALSPALKLVLIYSMLVGGCVGSTAGGIKVFRLLVLGRVLHNDMQRAAAGEHAVLTPRLGGNILAEADIRKALLIGALMPGTCLLSWLPFLLYGYDPLNALFEVVSAVGTVGLSSGVTAASLPAPLKAVLCFDMLAGRVEVLALLSLLYPHNWFGRREMLT